MDRLAYRGLPFVVLALVAACSTNPAAPPISAAADATPELAPLKTAHCEQPDRITALATAEEVIAACGEPSFRDAWGMDAALPKDNVIAPVEEWYYNPGPQGEVAVLRMVEGRLAETRDDGKGFDSRPATAGCDQAIASQGLSKYRLLESCGEPVFRKAYVVDAATTAPDEAVFTKGDALVVGDEQNGKVALYRESLYFEVEGRMKPVIVQNGRVVGLDAALVQVSSLD